MSTVALCVQMMFVCFCFFSSQVPGGIASESLTFTPLDDMIFLKWEEPLEPNGLITQYEVRTHSSHSVEASGLAS